MKIMFNKIQYGFHQTSLTDSVRDEVRANSESGDLSDSYTRHHDWMCSTTSNIDELRNSSEGTRLFKNISEYFKINSESPKL